MNMWMKFKMKAPVVAWMTLVALILVGWVVLLAMGVGTVFGFAMDFPAWLDFLSFCAWGAVGLSLWYEHVNAIGNRH